MTRRAVGFRPEADPCQGTVGLSLQGAPLSVDVTKAPHSRPGQSLGWARGPNAWIGGNTSNRPVSQFRAGSSGLLLRLLRWQTSASVWRRPAMRYRMYSASRYPCAVGTRYAMQVSDCTSKVLS
jgi:hypothetical protein